MTPVLSDRIRALEYAIARQVDVAPPGTKDYATANAALERRDLHERLLTVADDREADALVRRWLKAYAS